MINNKYAKSGIILLLLITIVIISVNTFALNRTVEDVNSEQVVNDINKEEVLVEEESLPIALQGGNENIGYEIIDDGDVLHLWNNLNHYYFDTSSGMQLTNHYDEYWTKNIFCLGYKTNNWNYLCNDALNGFTWDINTEEDSVEIIGYKDVTIQSYPIRMSLRYYLEENDEDLTVQPKIKNTGTQNINNDIRFVWKIEDIAIDGEEDNNEINVGWQYYYNLSDNIDVTYNNLNVGEYIISRGSEWLRLKWDASLNDVIQIKSESGQVNAPIDLAITTTGLNVNQEKTTTFYWIDATCGVQWSSSTPQDNARLGSAESNQQLGACMTTLNQCPAYPGCSPQLEISTRKGAGSWTNIITGSTSLCIESSLTANYNFSNINETDIRACYRAYYDFEGLCNPAANCYVQDIRNDIWVVIPASEIGGREAILESINEVIPGAIVSYDSWIYVVDTNGNHDSGKYDVVAEYGDKTWAFNYLTGDDVEYELADLLDTTFFWENGDLNYTEIKDAVYAKINDNLV